MADTFLGKFMRCAKICGHPSIRPGLKFRNHQTCRAWMGAHLPYRNTYHKGIYPFVEQTHHYAPDEIGCLFWWTDITHSHSFTISSPSSSSALPVSPFYSPPFMPLTICYFILLHVLLLLFSFFLLLHPHYIFYFYLFFLPRSVSPLHSRFSPFPLHYLSSLPFPHFHLSLTQH